jgi:hypothetical protein
MMADMALGQLVVSMTKQGTERMNQNHSPSCIASDRVDRQSQRLFKRSALPLIPALQFSGLDGTLAGNKVHPSCTTLAGAVSEVSSGNAKSPKLMAL